MTTRLPLSLANAELNFRLDPGDLIPLHCRLIISITTPLFDSYPFLPKRIGIGDTPMRFHIWNVMTKVIFGDCRIGIPFMRMTVAAAGR